MGLVHKSYIDWGSAICKLKEKSPTSYITRTILESINDICLLIYNFCFKKSLSKVHNSETTRNLCYFFILQHLHPHHYLTARTLISLWKIRKIPPTPERHMFISLICKDFLKCKKKNNIKAQICSTLVLKNKQ